jgi:predicted metal-dependent HD superfamily phosphohydrolase
MYLNNNLSYHNRQHILDGLDQIYRNYHLFKDPETVVVARLFHDVIYNTTANENEKKS